ncbi:MAG: transketolase family protein [Candidatus Woesearchaeota archaeon]|nr:MAG: transketolase family protein [Candidatus Woesearchaeota archaeon]
MKEKNNTSRAEKLFAKTEGENLKEVQGLGFFPVSSLGLIRSGFGKGICEAATTNKNIVALTADLRDSLKLGEFAKEFPERYFEAGICEQNMLSAAAGMTLNNKVPFVTSYAVFNPGRNWDQLRVSVCYSNCNVKIIGGHAGLGTGPDGATHQALEDMAITRVLPNLTVIVPCDEEEARQATLAAAAYKGPVYLRLSREKSLHILTKKDTFQIGKIQVLERGKDITIIACGLALQFALKASLELRKKGISAEVLNCSTIKPFDEKTVLKSLAKTRCVVSVEEHQIAGGLGSVLAETLSQKLPLPLERVGVNDSFGESGEGYELLEKYGISTANIVKAAKKVLKRAGKKASK